jgi:hypothetical protein
MIQYDRGDAIREITVVTRENLRSATAHDAGSPRTIYGIRSCSLLIWRNICQVSSVHAPLVAAVGGLVEGCSGGEGWRDARQFWGGP